MKKQDYINNIIKAYLVAYGHYEGHRQIEDLQRTYEKKTVEDLKRIYNKTKKYL